MISYPTRDNFGETGLCMLIMYDLKKGKHSCLAFVMHASRAEMLAITACIHLIRAPPLGAHRMICLAHPAVPDCNLRPCPKIQ